MSSDTIAGLQQYKKRLGVPLLEGWRLWGGGWQGKQRSGLEMLTFRGVVVVASRWFLFQTFIKPRKPEDLLWRLVQALPSMLYFVANLWCS